LFIDYGPDTSEVGDTLQAVSGHQKVDPLLRPGEVDLTARVDFAELGRAARSVGLTASSVATQGKWLQDMGLMQRAAALRGLKSTDKTKIARQVHRLTDDDEMGSLFKVLAVYSPQQPPPPGF
jgi:NADH dehydrogenase [ubiquinone] 1 alpha subcomplex assembly factor 7